MRKIMVVDDDVTSQAIVKALLCDEYEVVTANSGLQALGRLQESADHDLILLDMVMPGASGLDVLKTLKSTAGVADIPVIFLTGSDGVQMELESYVNGAADFIQKPVNADLLRLKIKRQLFVRDLKIQNHLLQEKLQQVKTRIDSIFDEIM